jgi:hypothetical protein
LEETGVKSYIERLAELRDGWIASLERDLALEVRPAYRMDESTFYWADWRLKLMKTIAEADRLIQDRLSSPT